MGWSFDWVSTLDSDFNYDFGRSYTEEEVGSFLQDGALRSSTRWRPRPGRTRRAT